ncbi:hypothetical protein QUC31_017057 [Theobroma cacao]
MESQMACEGKGVSKHIWVIPFPACGHILPLVDLTHQLLLRGLKVTILVTPKNLCYLNPLLSLHSPSNVQTLVFPFPSHSSLPPGVEQMQDLPISFVPDIATALGKLYDPLFQWFQSHPSPPVAILSDTLLSSWTTKLACHLNIPNISFLPFNVRAVSSWFGKLNIMPSFYTEAYMASIQSWGLVLNSFKELEGENLDIIKEKFTRHDRVWAVGPLLPAKAGDRGLNERGGPSSIPPDQLLADEFGVAIRVCKGLRSIPDSVKLARIFVDSTSMARPERVRAIKLQKTALNAIRKGGTNVPKEKKKKMGSNGGGAAPQLIGLGRRQSDLKNPFNVAVITSLHGNIEDEFKSLFQETQVATALDTVEQLVEEQHLNPLFSDKTNIMDVVHNLSTAKKAGIQYLSGLLEKG